VIEPRNSLNAEALAVGSALVLVEFLSDSRLLGFLPIVRSCTICLNLVAQNKDRCDILGCHSSVIGKRMESSDRVWEELKWRVL
jgi:hypothetical protein